MKKEISHQKIREGLADRNLRVVAERTGMAYFKLWRFATEKTKVPHQEDIDKLIKYLEL